MIKLRSSTGLKIGMLYKLWRICQPTDHIQLNYSKSTTLFGKDIVVTGLPWMMNVLIEWLLYQKAELKKMEIYCVLIMHGDLMNQENVSKFHMLKMRKHTLLLLLVQDHQCRLTLAIHVELCPRHTSWRQATHYSA